MNNGKPTLRTLATATGLAVTTVSRALKNAPDIAEATRRQVHEKARLIGYSPDRAAVRLRTGQTRVIAFLLEPHDEMLSFGTRMIAGIMSALRDTGYHLVVMPQFADEEPLHAVRNIVRNRLADGIVFCRTRPDDERARFLAQEGFPFITHGRTELDHAHDFVDFDNAVFARDAAMTLLAANCNHIALIGAPAPYTYHRHMLAGFLSAVEEAGARHEVAREIDISSPAEDIRAWAAQAIRDRGINGFVCGGEAAALAVGKAVSDLGGELGAGMSIVAKQTTPLFDAMSPDLTTVFEDLEAAGNAIGEALVRRLTGTAPETQQVLLGPAARPAQAFAGPSTA